MGSIARITADRARAVIPLVLDEGVTSQWLAVGEYRSCFCIATDANPSPWTIEGLLPDGQTIELANYEPENLFNPRMPRYIAVNAMCGLPIRFVSAKRQPDARLWVVLKS